MTDIKKVSRNLLLAASCAAVFSVVLGSCGSPSKTWGGKRTEALDNTYWTQSEWLSAEKAPVATWRADKIQRAADGTTWLLTTVKNDAKVVSAKWMTAGLGVYLLYVNGKPIGNEVLKPGFTHYAKTKLSFTYDVTDAFKCSKGAENQLAVQSSPGWWADKIITPHNAMGMIGKKTAFRGVLELTFSDGTKKVYGTNPDTWTAGIAGPVTHSGIFDGEEYDARIPLGLLTPEKLSRPEVNKEFNGEIVPSAGAEVYLRPDLAMKPVRAYVWKEIKNASSDAYGTVVIDREYAPGQTMTVHKGENLVIDFGQNAAAVPSFMFKAAEGTKLTCLPAELLNDGNGGKSRGMDGPEGSVHRTNLRIPNQGMRIYYTFAKTSRPVEFHPECTFFGYRYVNISATADVAILSIWSVPVSSITKELEAGTITTGSDDINKLISNTLWGMRSNYLSVPTDCPQRNERLGWTADTQVFAETGTFFANTDRFFHKWMRDMRDTQSPTGSFPGVAPKAQYGSFVNGNNMRLAWADAGIIVPWTIWKQYNDVSIINENWASIDKFMRHINDTKYDHETNKKENGDYQWADWLSYEPLESCANRHKGKDGKNLPEAVFYWNFLSTCYWLMDAEMMADMAGATGRNSAEYLAMADSARAYAREKFFDEEGKFKVDVLNTMQTPALFALYNNLVDGAAKASMIARLRKNFADHDNCLQTGFAGTSILMPTLTANGMSDIAYELLFQHKNPSWLYSIDNGATTIWERWNSYMKDKGMGPKGMNSFNHYAYGSVCAWIWKTVAGIAADAKAPGFKHIIMSPVPDKRLGHVDAVYKSASGTIKSSWKYDGDLWTWTFTIPQGSTATVTLPGETTTKLYPGGTYTVSKRVDEMDKAQTTWYAPGNSQFSSSFTPILPRKQK